MQTVILRTSIYLTIKVGLSLNMFGSEMIN